MRADFFIKAGGGIDNCFTGEVLDDSYGVR